MKRHVSVLLLFFVVSAEAQKLKKDDRQLMANLQAHVQYLSDDKLEGRRTGTAGEKLAADYISKAFQHIGLSPKGTEQFYQSFTVVEGKQVNPSTHLTINDEVLTLHKDYFPLPFSANANLESLPSVALQEADMPWFMDVQHLIKENAHNPHFDLNEGLAAKAADAKKKGASALFFYNSTDDKDGILFNSRDRSPDAGIPVVYLARGAAKKFLNDEAAILDVKLKTDIGDKTRKGLNVVGYLDNGAPHTIVLGAHFDHLGLGEDGNSLFRSASAQVHNGADDNASGTAALIELARLLKASRLKNNNYLFIAFSGEELGLYGSRYFVENPTIDLGKVNYMINMDMVGRLNDSTRTMTVGGFGTSPSWAALYHGERRSKLFTGPIQFRFDSSGTGPSDHTSFYRKNIPVLFYFTGLHTDYHRPSDDADKINFTGQMYIVRHIYSLIENSTKENAKLVFTRTREAQTTTSARFSVTMGIMPDYTFSGNGLRVDGVSKDRPAEKAGIQAGDVITALGDYKVSSVESYMQALGKFKKGDKTKVSFQRGKDNLSATVEF